MTPIEQKYQDLGGASSFLGSVVTPETPTPGGQGSYADYQHGMIFYNPAYGAVAFTQEIETKWKSASVATATTSDPNITVREYLGFPVHDSTVIAGNRGQVCYFERGMIVINSHSVGYVVYGGIYIQYRNLGDVNGSMGLPTSDEIAAPAGGRTNSFENANIYWTSGTGAYEVHGAIRDRYNALGGPAGILGYPTSNESSVMHGTTEVGRYNTFAAGSIYWSGASGAWEVHGSLRQGWLTQFGGPTGELGFPTSNETNSSGDNFRFNNFQHGVLAWQKSTGNIRKITKVDLVVNAFESKGDDGAFRGSQDLYVKMTVTSSTGFSFTKRYPGDGDMGASHNFDGNTGLFCTIPVMDGNTHITVKMEGWDSDWPDGDDQLGTINVTYTIDNLWDTTTANTGAQGWNGDFKATFNLKADGFHVDPNDSTNFRKNLFWGFKNGLIGTQIGTLSKEIFASTFTDVSQDETWFWHPFNALFYLVYKSALPGAKGVCFGMSLEAIYAIKGQSSSNEPVSQYGIDDVRKNQIAIKHGYQLGGNEIDFFAEKFIMGATHDPVRAFNESRDAFNRGEMGILSLSNDASFTKGHAVLPYSWDSSNATRWVIKIANPNTPFVAQNDGTVGDGEIIINPTNNSFTYQHGSSETWSGNSSSGGRMLSLPFSLLCTAPRTPFWEALALLVVGSLLIMADGGEVTQITDGNGKTFYKPGRIINEDNATRIPNAAEIKVSNAGAKTTIKTAIVDTAAIATKGIIDQAIVKLPVADPTDSMHYFKTTPQYDKMYAPPGTLKISAAALGSLSLSHFTTMVASKNFAAGVSKDNLKTTMQADIAASMTTAVIEQANARSLTLDVRNTGGGTYSWGLNTGVLSVHVAAPSVNNSVDNIAIDGIGTPGQAITFKLNANSAPKNVVITIGGYNENGVKRMFEVSNIALVAGQSVTAQISNGSKELILYNSGPDLSFDVKMLTSAHGNPVSVKTGLKIDANKVAIISPADWAVAKLPTAPVAMNLFDNLGGPSIKQLSL